MGNSQPRSPYSATMLLQNQVERELWDFMYQEINLIHQSEHNPFCYLYTILINKKVDQTCRLILLFPTHPIAKRRVLYTDSYTDFVQLGIEVNARIRESPDKKFQLVSNDIVYLIGGFTGNIYILWAKSVNQSNQPEQRNIIGKMIPFIIEMDGYGRGKSVVLLDSVNKYKILPIRHLTVFLPYQIPLFPCEARPDKQEKITIPTFGEAEAACKATESVMDATFKIPQLQPLEQTDSDGELLVEGDPLTFVQATPRFQDPGTTPTESRDNEEIVLQ